MTDYNFTIKLHPYGTAPDVGIVEIDPAALYGYFERKDGSEGGGLDNFYIIVNIIIKIINGSCKIKK
jgi:hypothetical protein